MMFLRYEKIWNNLKVSKSPDKLQILYSGIETKFNDGQIDKMYIHETLFKTKIREKTPHSIIHKQ